MLTFFFFNVFIASLHFDRFGDCNYVPPRFTDLQLFSWGGVQYCKWRFTSPPSRMSAGGRFGGVRRGVRGDRSLTYFYFSPPPSLNVKTLGFGTLRWGGPHLQLADPCVKFPRGAKLQSTFLIRPPAFNWPKGVVIIYLSIHPARLPQFWHLTTSKSKQFCETSFKNGKLSAALTASYQCVWWFFHSTCLKYCACHEKLMPGHTKCCTCHAKSS